MHYSVSPTWATAQVEDTPRPEKCCWVLQFRHKKGNPTPSSDFSYFPTCLALGVVLVFCSTRGPHLEALTPPELSTASDFPTPSRFTTATSTVPATQTTSSLLLKACLFCMGSSQLVVTLYKILTFCSALARFPIFILPTRSKMVLLHTIKDDLHPELGRAVLRPPSFKGGFHTPHPLRFNYELHPGAPQATYEAGTHSHHGSCY